MKPSKHASLTLSMVRIRDVVQVALSSGYLTFKAEAQLRQLLSTRHDSDDLKVFINLQKAASVGHVKQQSRELIATCSTAVKF
ncbi:hypothetical protein QQ056_00580 [Oscillatoria laete-virens NRMC-F 0139]|nr:hypothetical protein [Oscillatoria laete-virens]MDL5052071.1 hypothetical protein [Oscillatoria laete-virens NRMC-F 0139]